MAHYIKCGKCLMRSLMLMLIMNIVVVYKTGHLTRLDFARLTTGWLLSESIKPGSFISELKKFESGLTHHVLVGFKRVDSLKKSYKFFSSIY